MLPETRHRLLDALVIAVLLVVLLMILGWGDGALMFVSVGLVLVALLVGPLLSHGAGSWLAGSGLRQLGRFERTSRAVVAVVVAATLVWVSAQVVLSLFVQEREEKRLDANGNELVTHSVRIGAWELGRVELVINRTPNAKEGGVAPWVVRVVDVSGGGLVRADADAFTAWLVPVPERLEGHYRWDFSFGKPMPVLHLGQEGAMTVNLPKPSQPEAEP